jgi:hypothetical protein
MGVRVDQPGALPFLALNWPIESRLPSSALQRGDVGAANQTGFIYEICIGKTRRIRSKLNNHMMINMRENFMG